MARGNRVNTSNFTKSDKRYVRSKFHKLKQEGYTWKQRVAIALKYGAKHHRR